MGYVLIRGKKRKIDDGPVDLIIPEYNIVITETKIGDGTTLWSNVNIYGAEIGRECKIGAFVEIRKDVRIGDRVKIEPFVFIPEGVTIEDEVFVGPGVTFTNDKYPYSVHPDGSLITDYEITPTLVKRRASIGSGSTILCGVTIGEEAMIGIGSVVVEDVAPKAVFYGDKAKFRKYLDDK